jgi:hypothetical protein
MELLFKSYIFFKFRISIFNNAIIQEHILSRYDERLGREPHLSQFFESLS